MAGTLLHGRHTIFEGSSLAAGNMITTGGVHRWNSSCLGHWHWDVLGLACRYCVLFWLGMKCVILWWPQQNAHNEMPAWKCHQEQFDFLLSCSNCMRANQNISASSLVPDWFLSLRAWSFLLSFYTSLKQVITCWSNNNRNFLEHAGFSHKCPCTLFLFSAVLAPDKGKY